MAERAAVRVEKGMGEGLIEEVDCFQESRLAERLVQVQDLDVRWALVLALVLVLVLDQELRWVVVLRQHRASPARQALARVDLVAAIAVAQARRVRA